MAMLQQGGGGAPAGGAMPEDIMSLLGGGAEAPAPEGPEGALHGGAAAEGDPEEHYREALNHLDLGMRADVDEGRINTVMQCAAKIQGELAASEKGMDGMMAGKFDAGMMRRSGAAGAAY